ncbi:hypothetical protein CYMTET_45790 [Cymbomonas tetramitiformis]|uniref:Uncharacterized protein n=1 Tax=Cymbomonas tetramitiformis TaxID=36881 RepID=A0AAE0BXH8_9CHLO|nr:hypothetical protein CYMTET_45790 [Cymbomonas tetramitiformis]
MVNGDVLRQVYYLPSALESPFSETTSKPVPVTKNTMDALDRTSFAPTSKPHPLLQPYPTYPTSKPHPLLQPDPAPSLARAMSPRSKSPPSSRAGLSRATRQPPPQFAPPSPALPRQHPSRNSTAPICAQFAEKPFAPPIDEKSLKAAHCAGATGALSSYHPRRMQNGRWSDFPSTSIILPDYGPGPELGIVMKAIREHFPRNFELLVQTSNSGGTAALSFSRYFSAVREYFQELMIPPLKPPLPGKELYMENHFLLLPFGGPSGTQRSVQTSAALARLAAGEFQAVLSQQEVRQAKQAAQGDRALGVQKVAELLERAKTHRNRALEGHKTAACEKPRTVSFLVQFFRRPRMVAPIVARLHTPDSWPAPEILVNNDGAESVNEWQAALAAAAKKSGASGYQLVSGNLHEIRGYNRLAKLASGETLIFLQDDDLPPPRSVRWVEQGVGLLARNPKLGLVSGLSGLIEGGKYTGKYSNRKDRRSIPPEFKDVAGHPFIFASLVNMGPFVIPRAVFRKLGVLPPLLHPPAVLC